MRKYRIILTNRNNQYTATLVGDDVHTLSTNDSWLLLRWLRMFFEYKMWMDVNPDFESNDLVDSLTCSKNMTIYKEY